MASGGKSCEAAEHVGIGHHREKHGDSREEPRHSMCGLGRGRMVSGERESAGGVREFENDIFLIARIIKEELQKDGDLIPRMTQDGHGAILNARLNLDNISGMRTGLPRETCE